METVIGVLMRLALLPLLLLPSTAFAGDAAKGKTAYSANCMACHGDAGDGNGPAAMALDPKPNDFTKPSYWEGKTDEDVKKVIKSGKPGTTMAPFPQLTDEQLDDLVAYLRTFEPKAE